MNANARNFVQQLNSPNANVRCSAIFKLGDMNRDVAIPPLLECLDDPEANVAAAALTALKKLRPPGLSNMICSRLSAPQSPVRQAAVEGLGDLAAENALATLQIDIASAVGSLAQLLRDPEANVRLAAATALKNFGGNAVPAIDQVVLAMSDESAAVRGTACRICKVLGCDAKSASPTLLHLLHDEDGEVRQIAAETLGETGANADEAVPALLALIDDEDEFVVSSALQTLSNYYESEQRSDDTNQAISAAIPAIADALQHPSLEVRKAAADALGHFDRNETSVRNLCLAVRENDDRKLQQIALNALKSILESTIPEIDKVWEINQFSWPSSKASILLAAAMFALPDRATFKTNTPLAVERFSAMLRSDDQILHIGAAWWSGFAGLTECATPLAELLERTCDSNVRAECLIALGQIGVNAVEIGNSILRAYETGNLYQQGLCANALWRTKLQQTIDQACPVLVAAAELSLDQFRVESVADSNIVMFFSHVLWTLHTWHGDRLMPPDLRPRYEAFIEKASGHPEEFVRTSIRRLTEDSDAPETED